MIAQVISWVSLLGIVGPPILYLAGTVDLDAVKMQMLIATVVWFVFTPVWMDRAKEPA
jgi:hypothetical protein